ncbi:glycine decarboxylase subunit P, partial [Ascosphaera acerosa]
MAAPLLRAGGRQLARCRRASTALSTTRLSSTTSRACSLLAASPLRHHVIDRVAPARRTLHATAATPLDLAQPLDTFPRRHIGPGARDAAAMLAALDPPAADLDAFVASVIPASVLSAKPLSLSAPGVAAGVTTPRDAQHGGLGEADLLRLLGEYTRAIDAGGRSLIGAGYYGTVVPPVVQRNVLENPAWYTSYTPYQAEISQGRLESLLNFQTLAADLTGLPIANASLLDEGTAAAEAMTMSLAAAPASRQKAATKKTFLVSHLCHPQTIAVMQNRARGFGITLQVGDVLADGHALLRAQPAGALVGVLAQYPDTEGGVADLRALAGAVHAAGG